MIKEIIYNNKLVAIVYRKTKEESNINFLTKPSNNFQVGILNHPKNHIIPAHIHNPIKRIIKGTNEMLYIEKGKVKILFYNKKKEKIGEEILVAGELVNLISQAHGFEFLEKSRLIYVKQGPYLNKEKDKSILK